jgi:hypothetical protein
VFRNYQYKQLLHNTIGSEYFFAENATRLLDMKSNIKLDKLTQASQGGFASKTNITDIVGKTFTQTVFDYSKDTAVSTNKLDFKEAFSFKKNLNIGAKSTGGKSLSDLADASISNISVNSQANYQGNPNSSSGPVQDNISRAKSYYANFEAVSHQIAVYGDFFLNPGKKINIEIPKSINMDSYAGDDTTIIDKSLSGDYIISVAAHTFSDGIYMSKLKIIKDA